MRPIETRVFTPGPRVAALVRAFVVVEAHEDATRNLVPEPGFMVAFRFRGASFLLEGGEERRAPDAAVTGLQATARRMRTPAGGGVVVAKLREDAAARLFARPLDELFGLTIALDELIPRAEAASAAARLAGAQDHLARMDAFERFLLSRWTARRPDPVVAAAVRAIQDAPAEVRMGALAHRLGIGQDALEKRFRRVVGAPPKRFASIVRLRRAAEAYRPGLSLGALALDAGYYDQAHLGRELRAVAGMAPGALLGAGEVC